MKVYVKRGDYTAEIQELMDYHVTFSFDFLRAPILNASDGSDTGKMFVLREKKDAWRSDVYFMPSGSSWEDFQKMVVVITPENKTALGEKKECLIRFPGERQVILKLDRNF